MHQRHRSLNIPTEIARTLVVLSETRSFSQTGEKLGLSQPAISAQIKKLQTMVGGVVFEKTMGGARLNERGVKIVSFAKKLLEANDQIGLLGGCISDAPPLRVGLENDFVQSFFEVWDKLDLDGEISFRSDSSAELRRAWDDGYLDVACILTPPTSDCDMLDVWEEDYIWVQSENFALSPGAPIPIIACSETKDCTPALEALEGARLVYRISLTADDLQTRIEAVSSGLGIMAIPARILRAPLVRAEANYLPKLRSRTAGVCVRKGTKHRHKALLFQALKSIRSRIATAREARTLLRSQTELA
jgi:DNA-binding transcriptional LysR family regulator